MYAYGKVIIERPDVRALPESAIVHSGDQTYYWSYQNGHATRVEVQTGVSDGEWVEVTNRLEQAKSPAEDPWTPINGKEQVIVGDLSLHSDGAAVRLGDSAATNEGKLARAAQEPGAVKTE
jgi:hypothetical protein